MPPEFKLNPYDKDLSLAVKEDEKHYNHAIEAKQSEQIYDLTSTNFEKYFSRVNKKVHEYMLNHNNNFSVKLTRNGTATTVLLTSCYGETKIKHLREETEAIWSDTHGNIVTDADTTRRHMAFQVLANLLTEDAMADMTLNDSEYTIKGYHNPVLFFKAIVEKVKPSCRLNVNELKKDLRTLDLNNFKYHVPDDNRSATKIYKEIHRQGKEYNEYQSDLFDMYATAWNKQFVVDMTVVEDQYNMGTDITGEAIQKTSEINYHNLVTTEKWAKEDMCNAWTLALTTLVTGLVKEKEMHTTSSGVGNRVSNHPKKSRKMRVGEWVEKPEDGVTDKMFGDKAVKWWGKCFAGKGQWTVTHYILLCIFTVRLY